MAQVLVRFGGTPWYASIFRQQFVNICFFSFPIVGLTTIFAGMVLALQSATGFADPLAEASIPAIVTLAITRELAPVLAGLMVAGRVSASIAAELGSMRVTEQIDALQTMQTDPLKYLVLPRILAGIISVPILVVVGNILGIFGGYIVAVTQLDFYGPGFIARCWDALDQVGLISGLVKAAAFGLLITLMGCYQGYLCRGGAQGVGQATTHAVVAASILILVANYIITLLTISLFG
ncbi:MAG: ABC transporter permease [Pseudomonadota bacterium]